jgi:hypothetical protein
MEIFLQAFKKIRHPAEIESGMGQDLDPNTVSLVFVGPG